MVSDIISTADQKPFNFSGCLQLAPKEVDKDERQ